MTLRRTALTRRTELRRTPMPRRVAPMRARTPRPAPRPRRDTGPTSATRLLVLDRAHGCCELCGVQLHDGTTWLASHSLHHRRARGAGGTRRPETNSAANLLLLCGDGVAGCHGRIESHRSLAYSMGWLVHQGQDPALVPVVVHGAGSTTNPWVLLTTDGEYREVAA